MSSQTQHVVAPDEADIRLDRWFKRHYPALTHGQLQKLLRNGQIRLDGKRAKSNTRLEAGQQFRVPPNLAVETASRARPPNQRDRDALQSIIIYEDDDVLVLNKPHGLAVQGGTGLKNHIDGMLTSLEGKEKPKLVHRLDRDTSGVLMIAKSSYAAQKLTEAFRDRATTKIYWGVCYGVPQPNHGTIKTHLRKEGLLMRVADEKSEETQSALTRFEVIDQVKNEAAFLALLPMTGRTHQLRVHLQYIGHPLLGDPLYALEKSSSLPIQELGQGLHLHARRLIIPHPRRGTLDLTAPISPVMRQTFQWCGFDEKALCEFDKS